MTFNLLLAANHPDQPKPIGKVGDGIRWHPDDLASVRAASLQRLNAVVEAVRHSIANETGWHDWPNGKAERK